MMDFSMNLAGHEGCGWLLCCGDTGRQYEFVEQCTRIFNEPPNGARIYLLPYGVLVAAAQDAHNGMACYYLFETREAAEMYVLTRS